MDDSRSCDRSVAQALRGATRGGVGGGGRRRGQLPLLPSSFSSLPIHTYIYSLVDGLVALTSIWELRFETRVNAVKAKGSSTSVKTSKTSPAPTDSILKFRQFGDLTQLIAPVLKLTLHRVLMKIGKCSKSIRPGTFRWVRLNCVDTNPSRAQLFAFRYVDCRNV